MAQDCFATFNQCKGLSQARTGQKLTSLMASKELQQQQVEDVRAIEMNPGRSSLVFRCRELLARGRIVCASQRSMRRSGRALSFEIGLCRC